MINNKLQGSVAAYFRHCALVSNKIKKGLLLSLSVKKKLKSVNIWQSHKQEGSFLVHSLLLWDHLLRAFVQLQRWWILMSTSLWMVRKETRNAFLVQIICHADVLTRRGNGREGKDGWFACSSASRCCRHGRRRGRTDVDGRRRTAAAAADGAVIGGQSRRSWRLDASTTTRATSGSTRSSVRAAGLATTPAAAAATAAAWQMKSVKVACRLSSPFYFPRLACAAMCCSLLLVFLLILTVGLDQC